MITIKKIKEKIFLLKLGEKSSEFLINGAAPEIDAIKFLLKKVFYKVDTDINFNETRGTLFIINGIGTESQLNFVDKFKGKKIFILTDKLLIPDKKYLSRCKILSQFSSNKSCGINYNNKYHYFNFQKFPLLNGIKSKIKDNVDINLIYYGGLRNNLRLKNICKYYKNIDKCNIYTKSELINSKFFGKTKILNRLPHPEILKKINNSLCTVVVGDNNVKNYITQRFYESLLMKTLVFVDVKLDEGKKLFEGIKNKNYFYVKNKFELKRKIKNLKNNDFRRDMINEQQELVKSFDKDLYVLNFYFLIKRLLK